MFSFPLVNLFTYHSSFCGWRRKPHYIRFVSKHCINGAPVAWRQQTFSTTTTRPTIHSSQHPTLHHAHIYFSGFGVSACVAKETGSCKRQRCLLCRCLISPCHHLRLGRDGRREGTTQGTHLVLAYSHRTELNNNTRSWGHFTENSLSKQSNNAHMHEAWRQSALWVT